MTDIAERGSSEEQPSREARRGALFLLASTYAFSMLDRQIVTILAEPIKSDLRLADWQIGAMSGLAFAIFYTLLGVPIAQMSDRSDRPRIISAALALWSVFTMLCGLAPTFPALLLARMGVGVGEAGGLPASHSLITELTPRARLASALAGYSLGLPVGSLVGLAVGGLVADTFGWRAAFLLAGAPGILLALLTWTTLPEPRRARAKLTREEPPLSLREVVLELKTKDSFWWVSVGAACSSFGYYGQSAFFGSLLLRAHAAEIAALAHAFGLGPRSLVGVMLGLAMGCCAGTGIFLGGQLADRFGGDDIRAYVKSAIWALIAACPFMVGLGLAPSVGSMMAALGLGVLLQATINGPLFATVQRLVRPRARATAAAVMLFIVNLVGLGLGPLLTGLLSDVLSRPDGPIAGLHLAVAASGLAQLPAAALLLLALRRVRRNEHAPS